MTNSSSKHAEHFNHHDTNPWAQYKHCWSDALYNLLTHPIHAPTPDGSTHRLSGGTLSTRGKTIYGSPTNDPEDFCRNPSNAHCWIEDGDGRIWDYIHPQMAERGIKVPDEGIHIMGLTLSEIKQKYNLCYTRTANIAIRRIYEYAFQDYLPGCPRYDTDETTGLRNMDLGYHDFTMAPAELEVLAVNLLRRQTFNDWRIGEMKFNKLITGDEDTLIRWRDFYAKPLDRSRFTPVITYYGIKKTLRLALEDNYETDLYLNEGIAIGDLHQMKALVHKALDLFDIQPTI